MLVLKRVNRGNASNVGAVFRMLRVDSGAQIEEEPVDQWEEVLGRKVERIFGCPVDVNFGNIPLMVFDEFRRL